jgi:glycerol uptake facilitator protein
MYYPHWQATADADLKRAVFCTSPAIHHLPANLFAEALGTLILVFGIGAIFGKATGGIPHSAAMGPYLVGLLVWAIGLSFGGPTGYAINPARDFGPRLAHWVLPIAGKGSSDFRYALVPIVGPILGSVVGALLWKYLL